MKLVCNTQGAGVLNFIPMGTPLGERGHRIVVQMGNVASLLLLQHIQKSTVQEEGLPHGKELAHIGDIDIFVLTSIFFVFFCLFFVVVSFCCFCYYNCGMGYCSAVQNVYIQITISSKILTI